MLPGITDLINKGADNHTLPEIHEELIAGNWIAFTVTDEVNPEVYFICEIKPPVFIVGMAWGSRIDEWLDDVLGAFEKIARQCNCDKISINGRPGWVKLGKQRGFKPQTTTIVKVI